MLYYKQLKIFYKFTINQVKFGLSITSPYLLIMKIIYFIEKLEAFEQQSQPYWYMQLITGCLVVAVYALVVSVCVINVVLLEVAVIVVVG